jgi:lysophospholipase L1-like esterase/pimeloyl-ACP methyl ester carboxylesterase
MRRPHLLALTALAAGAAALPAQQRVACLGDSITFGARIADREHASYPARLQARDPGREVRNYGVGGATLLRDADRPFSATARWRDALAWAPDVAIVMLGTNDTCQDERRDNWRHQGDLERDAQHLVDQLLQANPDMQVLLATPPAMMTTQRGLDAARVADLEARAPRLARIAAALRKVAAAPDDRVDYVDMRRTLRDRDVVDGVHPDPFGADRIAQRLHEVLANPTARPAPALASLPLATTPDTFGGFDGAAFTLPETGARCRLFAPHRVARGAPWILRARFFGHQPALDLALLDRGFHLAYCDVADLYGNDEAVRRWDELHALLTRHGLARQVVLEGMSRGGLAIVNWAAANPDLVAAIYGDNPVADFRSWPGGQSGKRSDRDWQRCLQAYRLDEDGARTYARMPIDRLAPIAKRRVPLLLVLGEHDRVVPPIENGERLAHRYRQLGGPATVWRKPGQGHHPHGLSPVDPLLRAILHATGQTTMPTTHPIASVEYRRGAGWNGDTWRQQVDRMRALAGRHPQTRVVLLGDSITQGLTGATDRVAVAGGTRPFDRAFGDVSAIGLGLSGDRTEHLLWRIRNGALRELAPAVVVLQIGVNNVNAAGHTATETSAGIAAVVDALLAAEPEARVLICGPFPGGANHSHVRRTLDDVHATLPALATHARVDYLDLRRLFVDEDGTANDRMRKDRIHLTGAGMQAWLDAIAPPVRRLLLR